MTAENYSLHHTFNQINFKIEYSCFKNVILFYKIFLNAYFMIKEMLHIFQKHIESFTNSNVLNSSLQFCK